MSQYLLEHLWYFVIGFAMIAYVVLDGFDLGVGILHPFARNDKERRIFLNSIGPVWDGNEVWLVIFGGALFAGFPAVYATVFSGFYDLAMLFLAALIFRAVAIEFRSKTPSPRWRSIWDLTFAIASLGIAFGAGLMLGNFIEGIPLDEDGNFYGSFSLFLRPYSLLIGVLAVVLFAMHGAIYLVMKTEGDLHVKLRQWAQNAIAGFFLLYFISTCATLIYMPHMTQRIRDIPWVGVLPILAFLCFFVIPKLFAKGKDGSAFILSCVGIASLIGVFGIGTYPILIRSNIDPELGSWTIFNAATSLSTLKILLLIVLIGVPFVIGYGIYVYKIFRGKVRIDHSSY